VIDVVPRRRGFGAGLFAVDGAQVDATRVALHASPVPAWLHRRS